MPFILSIDTTNAAFHNADTGEHEPGPEVARIVGEFAANLAQGGPRYQRGRLADSNGNFVGEYAILEDD